MRVPALSKAASLRQYLVEAHRKYRDHYSLLFPHGMLRKAARKHAQYSGIEIFIETGTFKGKTAQIESRYFREVHTIELNEYLYRANLDRFLKEAPNVKAYLGDSVEVLPTILDNVEAPCLLFLDAHWSGDNRVDWDDSAWGGYGIDTSHRGVNWPPAPEDQCPLIDEAKVIGKHLKRKGVVIIDDWNSIGRKDLAFKGQDWSSISLDKIYFAFGDNRVLDHFPLSYKEKTRMIFLLKD